MGVLLALLTASILGLGVASADHDTDHDGTFAQRLTDAEQALYDARSDRDAAQAAFDDGETATDVVDLVASTNGFTMQSQRDDYIRTALATDANGEYTATQPIDVRYRAAVARAETRDITQRDYLTARETIRRIHAEFNSDDDAHSHQAAYGRPAMAVEAHLIGSCVYTLDAVPEDRTFHVWDSGTVCINGERGSLLMR